MREYRVVVEVDYVVKAESLSEAMTYVSNNAEYPLLGHENGYCVADRIVGGALYEGEKV